MLAQGAHTVLRFFKIQFLGNWIRSSLLSAFGYAGTEPLNTLLVVVEDANANLTTYWFELKPNIEVWISEAGHNEVHIPAICVKSQPGDQTRCHG